MSEDTNVQIKIWYDTKNDEIIYGMDKGNREKFSKIKKSNKDFTITTENMGDLASGLADGLDTFAKYYPQHIKADGLTKIAGGIQRGISYINITGVCKDLFDTNYSKALASISIEGVSWGIKQGIELNASKKTAFALSITTMT